MPLSGKRDEAEKRFKEAKRYSHPEKKEFDLDKAIRLLEEALALKPDNKQYRQKLDEIREIKAKRSLEFSMRAWDATAVTLLDGEPGTAVNGIIEQGTIRDGDEVKVRRGRRVIKCTKVFGVGCATGERLAVAGQHVKMGIIGDFDVREGDIIEAVTMELAKESTPVPHRVESNKYWALTAVIVLVVLVWIGGVISVLVILGTSWVALLIIFAIMLGMALLGIWLDEERKKCG